MTDIENRAIIRIRNATKKLLFDKPYYAHILIRISKELDFKIPTACVTIQGLEYKMLFNPFFAIHQTLEEFIAVLEHEICHLCYGHLNMMDYFQDHEAANKATDIEINQHVGKTRFINGTLSQAQFEANHKVALEALQAEVSSGVISKEEMYKKISEKGLLYFCFVENYFPTDLKKGSRWYYQKLLEKKPPKVNQAELCSSGASDLDFSDKDGQGNNLIGIQREIAQKSLENLIKNVDKDLGGNGRGVLPTDIQGWIEAIIKGKEESINWRAALRKFIQGGIKPEPISTRKRPSRRFGEGFPGTKHKTIPKGIIYWDQSGSVSTKEHENLFEELQHIYKTGVEIDIAPFNSQVLTPYRYNGEKKYTRTGGGTDFNVCQEHFSKQSGYSFCVMFTDGEAPVPKKFKKPCIWILTRNYHMEDNFPGIKVLMKKDK